MKKLILCLFLLSGVCWGQAGVYSQPLLVANGRPAVSTPVRVCSPTATGSPCNPVANIYSDSGLTQLIAQPGFGSDGYGNVTFYALASFYQCQATYNGVITTFPCAVSAANFTTSVFGNPLVVSGSGLPQITQLNLANQTPTGTTVNRLGKVSGGTVQNCTTTDTSIYCYPISSAVVANNTTYALPGTSGNAPLVLLGQASLVFDSNGGIAGDFVGVSTIAAANSGIAMSLGAGTPAGRCWTGTLLSSVGAGGTATIQIAPACSLAPVGYSTIYSGGVAQTQRTKINFTGGLQAVDNAGTTSTDVSIANPALFGAGTAAAPSITFAGQTDLGLYKMTAVTMGFSAAGTLQGAIGQSGVEVISTGAFSFCSDGTCSTTDVGFGRHAPGLITIDTNSIGNGLGSLLAHKYFTNTGGNECISAASPAVCGALAAGMVAIPTGGTLQVNTTAATADSTILFLRDNSLGTKLGVTCNTQSSLVLGTAYVTARTNNTNFTLALDVTPTANPVCGTYLIFN